MKLNLHQLDIAVQPQRQNLGWSTNSNCRVTAGEAQTDTWVHLLELPSRFSFDEALLLCQISEDQWLAWIPDHGEAVLHARQFCPLA